jgi:hypothetical protein
MIIDRQHKYFRESGQTILKVDETEYREDLGQPNKFRVTFEPVERQVIQE